MSRLSYHIERVTLADARELIERHHGYGSCGNAATYCFGVLENGALVAAYVWAPPPPGAAKSVSPTAPGGVLALSRMVAVPRCERELNHVSKPLRRQMRVLIDRGRWPALVTYSDEGQGHSGHTYKCSGWQKTRRSRRPYYEDTEGRRRSRYSNGRSGSRDLTKAGHTWIQRWEHWACSHACASDHMSAHGWRRVPIPGKVWRSGNPAFTFEKT